MTVSSQQFLQDNHRQMRALGDKLVASDATMEIAGYENLRLICKQFPHPVLSIAGTIDVPGILGTNSWQPQQAMVAMEGGISFFETQGGLFQNFLRDILNRGGRFDATVFEKTASDETTRSYPIYDALLKVDLPDRDLESKAQLLIFSGTISFHYFGE